MKGIELGKLIGLIEEIAPLSYAEYWDRSGLQLGEGRLLKGSPECFVKRILIALELNEAVFAEALNERCDFLLLHHPLFDRTGNYHQRLSKAGILCYAAHTSFDSAPGGNNDYLALLLGLKNISCFSESGMVGRKGELQKEMTLRELSAHIKEHLKLETGELRLAMPEGHETKTIKRIGLCSGSGTEYAEGAFKEGCEAFITGDMKHHQAQRFLQEGIAVFDAGHYGTEKFFKDNMGSLLTEKLRNAGFEGDSAPAVIISSAEKNNMIFP